MNARRTKAVAQPFDPAEDPVSSSDVNVAANTQLSRKERWACFAVAVSIAVFGIILRGGRFGPIFIAEPWRFWVEF